MFKSPTVPTETPQQVHDAMARGEIVLVDVREPSEYAVERIHGAMLFPLSTFDPAALPDAVGKQVVLQCGSGKRSEMAFQKAASAGVLVRSHMGGGHHGLEGRRPSGRIDRSIIRRRSRPLLETGRDGHALPVWKFGIGDLAARHWLWRGVDAGAWRRAGRCDRPH